jgi:hypothetical protein
MASAQLLGFVVTREAFQGRLDLGDLLSDHPAAGQIPLRKDGVHPQEGVLDPAAVTDRYGDYRAAG